MPIFRSNEQFSREEMRFSSEKLFKSQWKVVTLPEGFYPHFHRSCANLQCFHRGGGAPPSPMTSSPLREKLRNILWDFEEMRGSGKQHPKTSEYLFNISYCKSIKSIFLKENILDKEYWLCFIYCITCKCIYDDDFFATTKPNRVCSYKS